MQSNLFENLQLWSSVCSELASSPLPHNRPGLYTQAKQIRWGVNENTTLYHDVIDPVSRHTLIDCIY